MLWRLCSVPYWLPAMTVYLLGTGAAVSDPHRTTTMLAIEEAGRLFVIDCGGDAVQRCLQAGLDAGAMDGLYLTHEHPDHVSGFPLLIEKVWLLGREAPLPIYGIAPALDQARRAFATFDTASWDLPELAWTVVDYEPDAVVLDDDTWRITASPVVHPPPTVGLRIESKATGAVVAYSCDTEPSPAVVELARDANLLIHEATGAGRGHSSMKQAAEIAAEADARRLVFVHLPPGDKTDDLQEARTVFEHAEIGEERGRYDV